jgi:DNA-binding response OmpR family regulator
VPNPGDPERSREIMRTKTGVALIVDESLSARNLTRTLVTDALVGWDVLVARTADEALLTAAAVPSVDIAIIDRNVVGGGLSLAETLFERYPAIRIGCVTDGEADFSMVNGVTLIEKPLTEANLYAFVSGLVRRSA